MTPNTVVKYLVVAFIVTVVTFAVLMGGYAVGSAAEDPFGAQLLWRAAMADALVLVIVAILLLATLGLIQATREATGRDSRPTTPRGTARRPRPHVGSRVKPAARTSAPSALRQRDAATASGMQVDSPDENGTNSLGQ